MKKILSLISSFLFFSLISAQTWTDCNELILTVDDFNTDINFENQPPDCGCNNSGGECTLVRIRLVKTINGVETPVDLHQINFAPPNSPPLETNYAFKDYIDLYNPYFNCIEYQSQGIENHNYNISPVAPPGHEFHILVCPGSEQGQRRGRFYSLSNGTSLTAPTNVQASDGQAGLSVSFNTIPGKYYMAYRNTERCNETWVPIDPSMPWPQATGNTMTLTPNSYIPPQEFMYRVVCSDQGFVVASGTEGKWSDGNLGHYGSSYIPYDPNNMCSSNINDCTNDTTPPSCNGNNFTVQLDPGQNYYTFDINDFVSDVCSPLLTYENASIDFSSPNGTPGEFWSGNNDQFPCGTYMIDSATPFDEAGNGSVCSFTFEVECEGGDGTDSCEIESAFSNLTWSSYLGGDGEEEVMDIFVDENTGIQYVLGKTNSTNFYSTNTEIGTNSTEYKTFVLAINPNASLMWSTIINGWEEPFAINQDSNGNLILVGVTNNPNLVGPNLPGYDKTYNGGKDVLILKMQIDGSNLVYSSFYGGDGDDSWYGDPATSFTFSKERLKVDFDKDKILVLGTTNSTNLSLNNPFDSNPGNGFAIVINTDQSNSLEFATYTKNVSGAITAMPDGGIALIIENGNGNYSNLISSDAIVSDYTGFFPLPLLLVFDNLYNIEYGTYLGPHRVEGQSQYCQNSATNGTPGSSNLFNFQLKSDNCGNIYWYSLSAGFRQPIISAEYLLPSRKYRPALNMIQDSCSFNANNPLIKVNLNDESHPFIEYMLFFGYNGRVSANSSFDVDANGRPHFIARNEAYFNDTEITLPVDAGFNSDLYFIFENDLSDVQVKLNGNGNSTIDNLPINIKVYDNSAYIFGSTSENITSITPTWIDNSGTTNTIIQSNFGGGTQDGFISIIDNNEICEGCIHEGNNEDTTSCNNIVLHFDGTDDRVVLPSPLMGNSDFTITLDFKCGPQSGGTYPRLIGFENFETEIAVKGSELAYNNGVGGSGWKDSGINVADMQWRNVTLKREGTLNSLFLNGTLVSELPAPQTLNFEGNMIIGGKYDNSTSEYFGGSIDNLRVWNTALPNNEIQSGLVNPSTPEILAFRFEEGNPSSDNTSLTGPIDGIGNSTAMFSNFSLQGEVSNYLCDEFSILYSDPCTSDTTPPICSAQDINISLDASGQAIITPEMIDNGSVDSCSDVTLKIISQSTYGCNQLGINEVTLEVTDAVGNTSICSATVTIEDKTAPTCSTKNIEITVDAPGSATFNANDIDNGSSDNCSIQSMSIDINTFSCDDLGQNTVTLTLVDQSQNISTCTAIVSVSCNNPNPIWPGECETFESSTTQNWNTIAATLTIQDNGINGVGDMFLQVRDGSGASWAYNDVNFKGDYTQFGKTCICYDYLLINDAGDDDGIVSPRFFIYSGDPNAPDLQAGFYSTIEVTTDSGWTRVCATLGDCIDELPSYDQGYWDMRIGDGCDDWNTLIQNVDGIQFYIDLTSSPSEVHAYDNICIEGCPSEPCESMTINMSTGFDPVSEGLINPLNLDPNWILTAVPPDAGNIMLPRPAYVISKYSAWTSQGGAQWISPHPISGYGINNCAARNCTCDPYTLQRCFCVPADQNVAFDFSIFSDDKVEIYLIDNSSGGETLLASNCSLSPNHVGDPMIIDEEIFLKSGKYCIEARLYNTGGTAMGFNLQGSINGINLEKDICCMPYGRINGSVYNDLNCDGERAQNSAIYIDPAIEGYTVTLCDNNGSAIETVQTDVNGIYNFINIPEGDYIVKVQESQGFTYAPNTVGEIQTSVSLQNTQIIDFGLCEVQSCCIDQNIFSEMYQNVFSIVDNGCGEICLEMDLPIIDECDQIVVNWGDGIKEEVSSGVDLKHKYEATEIYKICATIVRVDEDGKVCNQVEECFDITVDLEADGCGPCENEKDFCERVEQGFVLSQNGLQLFLTPASLNSSDMWVVNWGDGNSSNIYSDENATTSNTYTSDGIYTVCMLVYSINANGKTCHEKTYCEKVTLKRPNSCCKDQEAFLEMVAKPFKISVKNCEVVIRVPKLNDCIRAFISWGDGEVTGVTSSSSNYLHSYESGTTSAQVCVNYEEVSGDRPCWKHRECFNVDLDCKGESCCLDSASIIVNGSFTGLAGGNINNSTSPIWQLSAHSPQINNNEGCENMGALQLWGNQYVSEQAQQSGLTFTAGNTYRIQFCGKFRPHAQKLPTTGRIRLRASNTPLSNQQDCPAGDCEEIYVTGDLGTSWESICLPDWSPSNDYSILTISASNGYFIDDGYYVSFVLIDDLCIQEIETTVTNECCASPELLSQSVVANVGASNIFCTEKDEVSLEVDGLLECQSVTKIWWGDGTSDDVTNNQIPLHTYMANGEWLIAVEVTSQASGGATCQIDIVEIPFVYKNCITSTKFEELDEQLLKLYPIPAKSQLTLSLSKNLNGYSGTIVNDSGQVIRSLDIGSGEIEQLIDLNGFTSGAYFIILNDKSNQLQLMARFIKI